MPNILRGFFNDEIVHLSAGDIISLKLFGLVARWGSAGASLTISRLK
ncbi:hypothetical protein OCO53_20360 [Peribacillus frigoritolerans]|nr:hypothetical protein [Peribacillus frigoritolerans]MCU6602809.1 hypothetical protein [Peribacillus frigoritolerans]